MKQLAAISSLALLSLIGIDPVVLSAQTVAVIAHPDVPVETISKNRVLDFYTGERRSWSNDAPVVPIDLTEPEDVRKTFYKSLGKSSSRMRSIWMRQKLSGEGEPPEAAADEAELILKVSSTPGAIGFLRAENVSDRVKLLAIL